MMLNIAILKKPQESAITFYRLAPWLDLARDCRHLVKVMPATEFTPDTARFFDVLICHRPGHISDLSAIYVAKKLGIKVIVDLDDLLWNIPIGNEAWRFYDKNADDILMRSLINADTITVSTPALRDEVEQRFGKRPIVVRNAIPPSLFYLNRNPELIEIETPEGQKPKPIKILWRGSNTHAADLYTHRDAFVNSKRIEWHFFGATPWFFLQDYGGQLPDFIQHTHTANILDYFEKLAEIRPHFIIVPLEENAFNNCKSEIAMLEAWLVGAGCIAPEWQDNFAPSEIRFKNPDDLREKTKVPLVTFGIKVENRLDALQRYWNIAQFNREQILKELVKI
jgi:hypothetical protein